MSANLIPPIAYFHWSFPCRRMEDRIPLRPPNLLDLSEDYRLADPMAIEDAVDRAEIRAGWNSAGLAFVVKATVKLSRSANEFRMPIQTQFWLDTRDARTVHRATKFCQRFMIQATSEGTISKERRGIHRASAEPPAVDLNLIRTDLIRTSNDWTFKVFFPAETLHGYDPETNRRLGFALAIQAHNRLESFPGWSREFPFEEDPSLWTTLELRGSS